MPKTSYESRRIAETSIPQTFVGFRIRFIAMKLARGSGEELHQGTNNFGYTGCRSTKKVASLAKGLFSHAVL